MKKSEQEKLEAITSIKKYFDNPPINDYQKVREYFTVYTKLDHVSKSGMMRVIDLYVIRDNVPLRISWSAALATGYKYNQKHEGMQMDGCGMDMGFAAVYALSRALWPKGFGCIGEGCGSNDHSNGDRNYTPNRNEGITSDKDGNQREVNTHWHSDGGYILNHRWM